MTTGAEETMTTDTTNKLPGNSLPRRGFLKALGLGAGAAAAGVAGDATLSPTIAAESKDERTKARYRETDHVKTFYRTNRY
jgi:anaerobic selenocysteine-containing dehydrogenase